jgi:hypothetical protein
MIKDFVLQLSYIGVFPQMGFREYRFRVKDEGSDIREVSLTIDDHLFGANALMFQEAPDLCYQKLLTEVRNENRDVPILKRAAITAMDIKTYRESHPTVKVRKSHARN